MLRNYWDVFHSKLSSTEKVFLLYVLVLKKMSNIDLECDNLLTNHNHHTNRSMLTR